MKGSASPAESQEAPWGCQGRACRKAWELAELRVQGVLETEGRTLERERDKDKRWVTRGGRQPWDPLTLMTCARCILGSASGLRTQ